MEVMPWLRVTHPCISFAERGEERVGACTNSLVGTISACVAAGERGTGVTVVDRHAETQLVPCAETVPRERTPHGAVLGGVVVLDLEDLLELRPENVEALRDVHDRPVL